MRNGFKNPNLERFAVFMAEVNAFRADAPTVYVCQCKCGRRFQVDANLTLEAKCSSCTRLQTFSVSEYKLR